MPILRSWICRTGIRAAPASILLHGPPGCGKTKLAKAVAGEAQAAFLSVGPSDILSKFVGESEASIRGLFQEGECLNVSIYAVVFRFHLHLQLQ
jgi:SpoVK/Ycf46/Vps4 family AAA+-type ATPase